MPRKKSYVSGDVVLVPFPYTDLTSSKKRPALVLSNAEHNEANEDIILCGMTSNLSNADHSVIVDPDDMEQGRLPRRSRIKATKIVTLHQRIIIKRIGHVHNSVLAQTMKELQAALPLASRTKKR